VLSLNNKIIWINNDDVPHGITSDSGYRDRVNDKFDSLAAIGLMMPGKSYNFTFTEPGEHLYHCGPYPWMRDKITIVQQQK
jgi:plastocyanin